MSDPIRKNAEVWISLYAAGKNDLLYPNENFVRIFSKFFGGNEPLEILDYGFGTGANLIHLARRGHRIVGVEVSPDALAIAKRRLQELDLASELLLTLPGDAIAFPDNSFDVVVAWQVIYYNDWNGLRAVVKDLERVTRPGGMLLVAIAAPGDISQTMADRRADGCYVSRVPGQEGCVLTIVERADIASVFVGRDLKIGEFSLDFGGIVSRHWIIAYCPK
jgi:SAM-dependent methyltransferase